MCFGLSGHTHILPEVKILSVDPHAFLHKVLLCTHLGCFLVPFPSQPLTGQFTIVASNCVLLAAPRKVPTSHRQAQCVDNALHGPKSALQKRAGCPAQTSTIININTTLDDRIEERDKDRGSQNTGTHITRPPRGPSRRAPSSAARTWYSNTSSARASPTSSASSAEQPTERRRRRPRTPRTPSGPAS